MAHNESISQLDAGQAFKRAMDGEHDAIRVVQALNTEMIIELNSEDGDSVQAVPRLRVIKPEDGEVACHDLRRVCKYGLHGTVEVSPDGVSWVSLDAGDMCPIEICATKIRVIGPAMLVGQS